MTSYIYIASEIAGCTSIEEITNVLHANRAALISGDVVRAMLTTIPKIVRNGSEMYINLPFVQEIIDQTNHRCTGPDMTKPTSQFVPNDIGVSANQLLKEYIYSLIEVHGKCIIPNTLSNEINKQFIECHEIALIRDNPLILTGIFFLLIEYTRWSKLDRDLWGALTEDIFTIRSFLATFADIATPLLHQKESVDIVTRIVNSHERRSELETDDKKKPFIDLVTRDATLVFHDEISSMYIDPEDGLEYSEYDESEIREGAFQLIIQLNNAFREPEVRKNYFYEYLALVSQWMPLNEERLKISERYEKYFGDDTICYMADIYQTFMQSMPTLPFSASDDKLIAMSHPIKMKIEQIIYDILANYPDTEPRIIELFFEETLRRHGAYLKDTANIFNTTVSAIVKSLLNSDAVESLSASEILDLHQDCIDIFDDDDYTLLGIACESSSLDDASVHRATSTPRASNPVRTAAHTTKKSVTNAYNKYKKVETQVDQTLAKGITAVKNATMGTGNENVILVEGKKLSPIGFMKKALLTVAVFNYSKIALLVGLIVRKVLRKKGMKTEKTKLLHQLEEEIILVDEKIKDAEMDGNREAKYALMRTKQALLNAKQRVKYGIGAEEKTSRLSSQVGGYEG